MEQKIAVISEMSFDECLDALKNLHEFTLLQQIWSGDNTPVMGGMGRIAAELAERIDELSSWVSVEDKLPENDGWYLCSSVTVTMNTNRTQPTMFQFRNGRFSHPYGICITHWYNISSPEEL